MLTESDKILLRLIQKDTRVSTRELADQSGLSQATVWRRLRDFEAAGLIRQNVSLLDPAKLGLGVCMVVNVNIREQSARTRSAFEALAAALDEVQLCMAVTGTHDYILRVWTEDVAAFERLLMDRILTHPTVAGAQSQLILRTPKDATQLPIF